MPIPGLLLFLEFLCQPHSDLHTVNKAGAFMVTAEGADRIHDSRSGMPFISSYSSLKSCLTLSSSIRLISL